MPIPYERMKKLALDLLREKEVRSFSAEELHRAFKHSKEKLLYTAIVRKAIEEEGLTINSLYEQDRDNGRSR